MVPFCWELFNCRFFFNFSILSFEVLPAQEEFLTSSMMMLERQAVAPQEGIGTMAPKSSFLIRLRNSFSFRHFFETQNSLTARM